MAHLHFKRTVYQSGGGVASKRLEYITRQPERDLVYAERQLRYIREDREDLVEEQSRNLPEWAQGNPHVYFRAAEQYEGANRVAFEEWKVTLPQEFSQRQNQALTRDLVEAIAGTRLPITYAFHNPTTLDGKSQQPHLHLLISARQNDAHPRTAETHFKRYNRAHPERGGAEKDPAFWHKGAIKAHRVLIADIINLHLEYAGQAARVHPDRLDERGIDRQPEPKLLQSEGRAYREQGSISPRMQAVLDIRQERLGQEGKEQAQARTYWEARKEVLGITAAHSMAHKLSAVTEARTETKDYAPDDPARPVRDMDKVWRPVLIGNQVSKIYHTPEQRNYGDVAPANQVRFRTEREAVQAGYRRARNDHYGMGTGEAQTGQARGRLGPMASKFERLTRLLGPDDTHGHGTLDVRVRDEALERGQGRGF